MRDPASGGGQPELAGLAADVRGTVDGAPVDGAVRITVQDDGLHLRADARTITVPYGRIDGVTLRDDALTIAAGAIQVTIGGAPLGALTTLAADTIAHSSRLPELARASRALGAARAGSEAAYDRVFAILLEARRRAELAPDFGERIAAFASYKLRQSLERTVAELAHARYPDAPPYRRSIEAELLDALEPLFVAVDALAPAAVEVQSADALTRLAAWRGWVAAARRVFDVADRVGPAVRGAMARTEDPLPQARQRGRRRGKA
jgi:hypothetical protein